MCAIPERLRDALCTGAIQIDITLTITSMWSYLSI